jgi:putative ATP-dependent endonuclease of OLD family
VKSNGIENMNKILGTNFKTEDDLHKYMKKNKTDCAIKIFDSKEIVKYPQYILDAIK